MKPNQLKVGKELVGVNILDANGFSLNELKMISDILDELMYDLMEGVYYLEPLIINKDGFPHIYGFTTTKFIPADKYRKEPLKMVMSFEEAKKEELYLSWIDPGIAITKSSLEDIKNLKEEKEMSELNELTKQEIKRVFKEEVFKNAKYITTVMPYNNKYLKGQTRKKSGEILKVKEDTIIVALPDDDYTEEIVSENDGLYHVDGLTKAEVFKLSIYNEHYELIETFDFS